MVYRCWLHFLL